MLQADVTDVHLGNAYTIQNGARRRSTDSVDRSGSVCLPNGAGYHNKDRGADAEHSRVQFLEGF
jgi:hypothetical protein